MFKPAIYRVVSLGRKAGKTKLIVMLAEELLKSGVRVAVIKHSTKGIDLRSKDTNRYASAGIRKIVFISPKETVLLLKYGVEDLNIALSLLGTDVPIILVEGFKNIREGKAIGIVSTQDDVNYYLSSNDTFLAIICTDSDQLERLKGKFSNVYLGLNRDNAKNIAQLIIDDALHSILSQLPGLNCGYCGFSTCRGYAKAYLYQLTLNPCPRMLDVVLRVNGAHIPLSPYPKRVITTMLCAFINTLKGVPKDYKVIEVKINLGHKP